MKFDDRKDAAHRLVDRLAAYKNVGALVLAIPRGAVPMGRIVADSLGADLDVVLVRKLRAPRNPEFAIGAIDESGWTYISPAVTGIDASYLEQEIVFQQQVLRQRRALYTPERQPMNPRGRIVIVIDDGLATGATMVAALHAVGSKRPEKIVCAVPVAAPESLALVRPYADKVVCLHAPENFMSVGEFYRGFEQVEDHEVVALLA